MNITRGSSRSFKKTEWEDDGLTVPWLATALAVYILAVLNNTFWQACLKLWPLDGTWAVFFYGLLFVGLAALHALVLSLLTIRKVGKFVLMVIVMVCAVASCLAERGVSLWSAHYAADLALAFGVGLTGVIPALVIFFTPLGRRRGIREIRRRARFAAFCGCAVLAAFALIRFGPGDAPKSIPVSRLVPYVLFDSHPEEFRMR